MGKELDRCVEIVAKLRAPGGCPWDREQTNKSILSCLLDEAYEFFEAVDQNDNEKMTEELGDLLLQVVLHAQIAQDEGRFNIEDVARGIADKLIRRHPHVFGDVTVGSSTEVIHNWERIKKIEKEHRKYLVDDIPEALPALFKAEKSSAAWPRSASIGKTLRPCSTRWKRSSASSAKRCLRATRKTQKKSWAIFCLLLSMSAATTGSRPKTRCA